MQWKVIHAARVSHIQLGPCPLSQLHLVLQSLKTDSLCGLCSLQLPSRAGLLQWRTAGELRWPHRMRRWQQQMQGLWAELVGALMTCRVRIITCWQSLRMGLSEVHKHLRQRSRPPCKKPDAPFISFTCSVYTGEEEFMMCTGQGSQSLMALPYLGPPGGPASSGPTVRAADAEPGLRFTILLPPAEARLSLSIASLAEAFGSVLRGSATVRQALTSIGRASLSVPGVRMEAMFTTLAARNEAQDLVIANLESLTTAAMLGAGAVLPRGANVTVTRVPGAAFQR